MRARIHSGVRAAVLTTTLLSTVSAQTPLAGHAPCFDGLDDHIRVPSNPSIPNDIFTVCAWVKAQFVAGSSVIISRGDDDDTDNLPWDLRLIDGEFAVAIEDSLDVSTVYDSGSIVADGSWHHVAATRDASNLLLLYVDGEQVGDFPNSRDPSNNNDQFLSIGCIIGSSGTPPQAPIFFLRGLVDDVAAWSRALDGAEIDDLYQHGVDDQSPDLWGHWTFDEGSGQIVGDSSPNGNDGFLGTDALGTASDPAWVGQLLHAEVMRGSPPNPGAFLPGQTSGPVIGSTWDPVIDHTTFVPTSIADFALITGGPANIPLGPEGTLLCNVASPILEFVTAPSVGAPLQIGVPSNCALVGLELCAQGGSIDAGLQPHLANALDITIGTF